MPSLWQVLAGGKTICFMYSLDEMVTLKILNAVCFCWLLALYVVWVGQRVHEPISLKLVTGLMKRYKKLVLNAVEKDEL